MDERIEYERTNEKMDSKQMNKWIERNEQRYKLIAKQRTNEYMNRNKVSNEQTY
jgi:hypothetical protein